MSQQPQPSTSGSNIQVGSDNTDGNMLSEVIRKQLDVNKYATKKTIAQGLLDVALLTANASQLKYVLQVGEQHEFYYLMLTLIIISIVLQLLQACMCILLGSKLNLNKDNDHDNANLANNIVLCINVLLMAVNVVISSFEYKEQINNVTTSIPTMISTTFTPLTSLPSPKP